MYTLIRERVASMYELTYVYNLDEMLKLYDLIMMQREIDYGKKPRGQKGGYISGGKGNCNRKVRQSNSVQGR